MNPTLPQPPIPPSVLDTSKMSAGQRAAIEMTEAARDESASTLSFAASLFNGDPDFTTLLPYPVQSVEDRDQGDAFLHRMESFLALEVDPDAIDRDSEIPDHVLHGLAQLGAFGIKIPTKYGGLGLSQTNYSRTAALLGGICGNLTALLSAHQSIGVPQPLIVFGTEEQKQKFLPRCARGEISAFALTEPDVGSDPARMKTTAIADSDDYLINGEKLWCTNGTKAGLIVVMAKTPTEKHPHATTAFIVETSMPGVEIVQRCHFMGLRALYNGVIRFHNVRVPKENIIGGEGRGLKVALTTLNTGRITLPAACAGLAKRCLEWTTQWAAQREQWGQPIGKHAAIADKIARMAAHTFALEAMVHYVSFLVDRDKSADVRLEAALAKLWGTERSWQIVDDTMQIRGGRGYETADSQRDRGEKIPMPIERFFRDSRINTLFEGSSEIMRLFIAREFLDPHLKLGAAIFNTKLPLTTRARTFVKAGWHYARWYPSRWLPGRSASTHAITHPLLEDELRHMQALSRKLSRSVFHAMLKFGPKLEREQLVLGRLVDIGADLFAWSCAISRAESIVENSSQSQAEVDHTIKLVQHLGSLMQENIHTNFQNLFRKIDHQGYSLAKHLLEHPH
ncbi:DNA polymerase II [Phragmitibacter flavus]|uniref:DNA polymerase II n=1 Tax=Phragmitibacter flavus TaxID=2576071 RepID=A0A5R8KIJ7_9BACT|nr:acyl-CoA dehydrogenase family protein [Phragmitibacter flavus]TLD72061.1 DNA polymerase II [Phragmitibacter flavus]